MSQQKTKTEDTVEAAGYCEACGYSYRLTIPVDDPLVKCPKCGKYSQNFAVDYSQIPPDDYDLEKENYKKCPVCEKTIGYHVDGFIHYEAENVWVHADHTVQETEKALKRLLTDMEKAWITF